MFIFRFKVESMTINDHTLVAKVKYLSEETWKYSKQILKVSKFGLKSGFGFQGGSKSAFEAELRFPIGASGPGVEFESRVSSLNLKLRFHGKEGLQGRVSSMGEGFK